jgi:hypothetical protein
MNLTDMRARLQRLNKLAQGLGEEASLWKKCADPLLLDRNPCSLSG